MAEISKINVNGTEYNIRSSFPTIQMLNDASSPATDFSGSIKPYNIYGKIYKINFEVEVPHGRQKTFTLKDSSSSTTYEVISGEGAVVLGGSYFIRMQNLGDNERPSLKGLNYLEGAAGEPLKLEFSNNNFNFYNAPATYYIEFTLYQK